MDRSRNRSRNRILWRPLLTLAGIVGTLGLTHGPAAASPAKLRAEMADIARVTRGPVGAAAVVAEEGRIVALRGEQRFPMQSVYKLSVAMAMLHQVDLGRLGLDQRVKIGPGDLVPPSQVVRSGTSTRTVRR